MTIQELFVRSNQELKQAVAHIRQEDWDLQLPEGISRKPSTLAEAVRYHAYDDAWVPDVLAGKTKEEVADKYESVRATEESSILDVYNEYNAIASVAVRDFNDLDKIVHLSYGDFSAKEYLQHITVFRAFRSYDIASMIGANTVMDVDFVQALWDEYAPLVDGYRQMGVFGPAIENIPEDSSLQVKLLALFGRKTQ